MVQALGPERLRLTVAANETKAFSFRERVSISCNSRAKLACYGVMKLVCATVTGSFVLPTPCKRINQWESD